MSDAWAALRDGARRVNGAPAILFGAWALLVAAILQTRVALHVPAGVAVLWVREMLTSATDAPAAVLLHATTAEAVAIACSAILAWLFITGGILDRFARDRAVRSFGFFGVSGACFFRFLRLAAVQAVVYRLAFVDARIPAALVIGACSIVADYARVRAVVEDRRSMLGAVLAAAAFIWRNIGAVAVLFAIEYAIVRAAAEVLALWADTATLAASMLAAVWLKLLMWASETALFQRRLAHAGYVARPEPAWPESPAAEAITG